MMRELYTGQPFLYCRDSEARPQNGRACAATTRDSPRSCRARPAMTHLNEQWHKRFFQGFAVECRKVMQKESCDIGLIGLAVMGQNLILNMNDHGYRVAVFNRTVAKVDEFTQNEAAGTQVVGTHSIEEFVQALKKPRRAMLMVKAGDTVDQMIESLLPHLEAGDIVIDGGNSHYPDTNRRTKSLAEKEIIFIGTGVSGGEEGARFGPSIMPGGNPAGWPHVKEIFQAIAAKVEDGLPCCDWVGE